MKKKVLVAGFATRHVVQSAFGAGYEVYAVDHFCDQDLSFYARESMPFAELDELPGAVEEMCRRHEPDILAVTSGAEALSSRILCGTSPEKARRFLDKLETHRFFDEIGVSAPALLPEGVYPSMVKPRSGSGGWRNRVVRNTGEREAWKVLFGDIPVIIEEVAEGIPCSVCCLADGKEAVAVAVNTLSSPDRAILSSNGERNPWSPAAAASRSFILPLSVTQAPFSLFSSTLVCSKRSSFFPSTETSLSIIPFTSMVLVTPGRLMSGIPTCQRSSSTRSPIIS